LHLEMNLLEAFMLKISVTLPAALMTVLLFTHSHGIAAENRTPTPEELKEMVRKYNENGGQPALQRQPQIPKGAEQFNKAVALHTKKNPTAKELKEAAALYQAASDSGIPQASTNLALLYLEGKGVKKDVNKALSLLNSAAGKNETQADIALARLYLTGKDVKKDEKKGEALLNKAVKAGNPNAAKILAEYREWKKKNELAMKEYQELMKKVQLTQVKPGGKSLQPLQILPQTPTGLPFPYTAPQLQFPVIPGYSYISTSQAVSQFNRSLTPQMPTLNISPGVNTSPQSLAVK
jgi:hypothetical protein